MSGLNAIEMSSLLRPRRNHVYRRTYPRPDTHEPEGTRCPHHPARRSTRRTHSGRGRTAARQKHPADTAYLATTPDRRRCRPRPRITGQTFQPPVRPPTPPGRPCRLPTTLCRLRTYLRQREVGPGRLACRPADAPPLADRRRAVATLPPPRPASQSPPTPGLLGRVGADGRLDPRLAGGTRRGHGAF